MKILFVVDTEFVVVRGQNGNSWDFDLIKKLASSVESKIIGNNEWSSAKNKSIEFNPDIVVLYDVDKPRGFTDVIKTFNELDIPVATMGDDLFHLFLVVGDKNISRCNAILFSTRQEEIQQQYREIYPNKYVGGLDLYVNIDLFNDNKVEKIYDITIYGALDKEIEVKQDLLNAHEKEYFKKLVEQTGRPIPSRHQFYPLRKRVSSLILANRHKYKVNYIPCGKVGSWSCAIKGKELSIEIGKSYLALATGGRANKCMHKYLEIAASNTHIIGDIPRDFKDLFIHNITELSNDMTDDEILRVIDGALSQKEEILQKSIVFGEYVRKTYGNNSRRVVDDFLKHCNAVISCS